MTFTISQDIIILIFGYVFCIIYLIILLYITFRYFIFPKLILELGENPMIKKAYFVKTDKTENKEKYKNEIDEYKYNKKIDKVPSKFSKLTIILLRENKWAKILYMSGDRTHFRYGKCLYFIYTPHTCDNNAKLLVYLEGISLPLSIDNVQKEIVKRTYIDLEGREQQKEITVIKGLKWDGKILHLFTDRKFAEIFTKVEIDKWAFIVTIIAICTLIIGVIGIGVTYYFRGIP